MDRKEEEQILSQVNQAHRGTIQDFPKYAREKIVQKLKKGYFITACSYLAVEVQKGYSGYKINRQGTTTPV